jgi:pimeloyl-ACP methyl ester carboxylesterase
MKPWHRRVMRVALAGVLLLILAVTGTSLVVRHLAAREAKRDFPPPGRALAIDGRLQHIHCLGEGTPTVVLESGLDDRGSTTWSQVHEELAHITRTCSYDRAGLLWSERGAEPRDAEQIAQELHALLAAASEEPPYVLVGHSLGALYTRVYDHRHPGEVAGFVWVDPAHPEQEGRFPPEVQQRMRESDESKPPRWLVRLVAPYRMFAPERSTPRTAYWWRSLPEGVLGEVAAIQRTFARSARTGELGDRPLIVLTAGVEPELPGLSAAVNQAFRQTLLQAHRELTHLTTNANHRIVDGAGHYIHLDRPEAVVAAVREVVTAAR